MFYLEILKGRKYYHWRLKGKNRKILCHSECYTTRGQCRKTAKLVANNMKGCVLKEVICQKKWNGN